MMCAATISAFCAAPRRQANSTARSLYELPRTGTRIFITAETPRMALATAAWICAGGCSIHHSRLDIETAKTAAISMPRGCNVTSTPWRIMRGA